MQESLLRRGLYYLLAIFILLHTDTWFWHDSSLVFGLPVGLFYQAMYCVGAVGILFLLVRFAWPDYLTAADEEGDAS